MSPATSATYMALSDIGAFIRCRLCDTKYLEKSTDTEHAEIKFQAFKTYSCMTM